MQRSSTSSARRFTQNRTHPGRTHASAATAGFLSRLAGLVTGFATGSLRGLSRSRSGFRAKTRPGSTARPRGLHELDRLLVLDLIAIAGLVLVLLWLK